MDIILVFDLLFLIVGLITGAGMYGFASFLRKYKRLICLELSPSTKRYAITYKRVGGKFLQLKTRDGKGLAPLVSGHLWHPDFIGNNLLMVDREIALTIGVDAADKAALLQGQDMQVLGKKNSQTGEIELQVPIELSQRPRLDLTGYDLQKAEEDITVEKIRNSDKMDIATLAKYGLLALVLIAMLIIGSAWFLAQLVGGLPGGK